MNTYRVLIEYFNPNKNNNFFEEKIIKSNSSRGKIADNYLTQDRMNLIRSVDVTLI